MYFHWAYRPLIFLKNNFGLQDKLYFLFCFYFLFYFIFRFYSRYANFMRFMYANSRKQ